MRRAKRSDPAPAGAAATPPQRRCLATGISQGKDRLIRFAVGPDGNLYPDVDERLPGRGLWVSATAAAVTRAIEKGLFARAARRPVLVPPDLKGLLTGLLRQRVAAGLGLARRAGQLQSGFDKVSDLLRAGQAGLLISASDAAADGKRKLAGLARGLPVMDALTGAELSLALGRENVVHAALTPGRLADRLILDAARLDGFRELLNAPAGPAGETGAPLVSGPDGNHKRQRAE